MPVYKRSATKTAQNQQNGNTMAASGETEMTPIESRDALAAYIEQGEKPKAEWRIGTEHEKIPVLSRGLAARALRGAGRHSALLEGMAEKSGWRRVYDLENVIALEDAGLPDSAARSRLSPAASSSFRARRCRRFFRPAKNSASISASCATWPGRSASRFWASAFLRFGRSPKRPGCPRAAMAS